MVWPACNDTKKSLQAGYSHPLRAVFLRKGIISEPY